MTSSISHSSYKVYEIRPMTPDEKEKTKQILTNYVNKKNELEKLFKQKDELSQQKEEIDLRRQKRAKKIEVIDNELANIDKQRAIFAQHQLEIQRNTVNRNIPIILKDSLEQIKQVLNQSDLDQIGFDAENERLIADQQAIESTLIKYLKQYPNHERVNLVPFKDGITAEGFMALYNSLSNTKVQKVFIVKELKPNIIKHFKPIFNQSGNKVLISIQ